MSDNEEEIRTITEPIKEANWAMFEATFKFIGDIIGQWRTILAAVIVGLASWHGHAYLNDYRYINYIDKSTIEIAKDMQAICNERHVCNKDAIIAKMQAVSAEGFVQQAEEGAGLGK